MRGLNYQRDTSHEELSKKKKRTFNCTGEKTVYYIFETVVLIILFHRVDKQFGKFRDTSGLVGEKKVVKIENSSGVVSISYNSESGSLIEKKFDNLGELIDYLKENRVAGERVEAVGFIGGEEQLEEADKLVEIATLLVLNSEEIYEGDSVKLEINANLCPENK